MAQKKRRKDGYLTKSFTYAGKRYFIYGRNAAELMQKEIEKRQQLEKGTADRENPTLKKYYEYFTSIRKTELKESTLRAQAIQFKTIASTEIDNGVIFGNIRINDLSRRDIETARQTLLNNGYTPEYINICFAHLNHILNTATIEETIIKNPCKALKPLKRVSETVNETKHRALSEEETIKFFKAAGERKSIYFNTFRMLLCTGCRIGEISSLTPADIDERNHTIIIHKTVTRNEIGQYIISDTTKTKAGKREIPYTTEIQKIIANQKELNSLLYGIDINKNVCLFKSADGQILREYTINREIERVCKAAKIEKFTCHAFRNTFATRFIEQRPADYKILSEILGHKDISITLNLYTHVMKENKINALESLNIKIS